MHNDHHSSNILYTPKLLKYTDFWGQNTNFKNNNPVVAFIKSYEEFVYCTI